MPVAWKVLKAQEKHAWKPEWLALLKRFRDLLPEGWTVIVSADRGLYTKWLIEAIVELKSHPFLRVNTQGPFRPEGWFHWQPFSCLVPTKRATVGRNGEQYLVARKLNCAARCWATGAKNIKILGWLLTDLVPECADTCWYGLRTWIEQGFNRSGWQWQHTRMDDPARAERLWMAIAIAIWWLLSIGGEAETQADTPLNITEPSVLGAVRRRGKRWRMVGIFQYGWSLIIVALLNHQLLPAKPGRPEVWPG